MKTDIIPIYAERMTEKLYTVETCQWCVSFVFYRKIKEFIDRKTEDILNFLIFHVLMSFNPSIIRVRSSASQSSTLQLFNYLISHPSPPLSEGLGEVPKSPPSYSIRKMGMVRLIQFFNPSRVDELQRVILKF